MFEEDNIEYIRRLLKKKNYLVKVTKPEKDKIHVSFPKRLDRENQKTEILYTIRRGKKSGFFYENDLQSGTIFVAVPDYAIRIGIALNIFKECRNINYSKILIQSLNENNEEVVLDDLIPGPTTRVKKNKEFNLMQILVKNLDDGFVNPSDDLAQEAGVLEAYLIMKGLYV